ncbi:Cold-regulated protein 28 [Cardamine amara subsp. amara]|uniref:Cold-regulated protein 28 n=1 Tax=Cardamine amara subsp. amara TaxID=228776 RepID=A0ABD1BAH7_CARAN
MEKDYTMMNIVSVEMDRDADASAESTLSNSLESAITAETSPCDADSELDECAVWTNEKHSSYLDYLESSFVRQLYSLLGEDTQRLSRTRDVQSKSHKSTDQFKVLQNGCWQKVNVGNKQAHLETSSEFRFQKNSLGTNPEKSEGNVLCHEETKHSGGKAFARNSVGREYPDQSTAAAEASGQNFREEEEQGEVSIKREREANNDDSSLKEDQVVPVRMVKPRM